MIATKIRKEQYEGNLRIYCHSALVETVRTIANLTLPKKFTRLLDHRIQFVPLHNGDTKHILDYDVTFLIFYLPRLSSMALQCVCEMDRN